MKNYLIKQTDCGKHLGAIDENYVFKIRLLGAVLLFVECSSPSILASHICLLKEDFYNFLKKNGKTLLIKQTDCSFTCEQMMRMIVCKVRCREQFCCKPY